MTEKNIIHNDNDKNKKFLSDSKIFSFSTSQKPEIYPNLNSNFLTDTDIYNSSFFKKVISIQGYLYNLLGNFLSCVAFFIFKHYTNTKGIPPETLMAYRGCFFCIYSGIYILLDFKNLQKFDITYIKTLLFRSSVNGVGMMLVIYALKNLRVSTCELILRFGNVMSVFMGYLILNEKVTIYDIYGLISTGIGVILILKPVFIFGQQTQGEDKFIGALLAFVCAFLISWGVVITKKLLEKFDMIFTIFCMGLIGCFVSITFAQFRGIDISIDLENLIGVASTIMIEFCAVMLNFKSLKYEPVVKLAPFYNSRIIYSVIMVYILTGDIDFLDIFGVSLIVITYIYISVQKIKLVESQALQTLNRN
jgi:drug/metabolite transporter (DMT)-like permease